MKPWRNPYWIIPAKESATFVYHMERVLEVYHRPYDARYPVICMDESPNQLIGEVRAPIRTSSGEKRHDYEYKRNGTVSLFLGCEPLAGKRWVAVRDQHRTRDWIGFMLATAKRYAKAEKITVVLDNLSTHQPAKFYDFYTPQKAQDILDRFEFVYTPPHGSWLNIAEIEINVLKGQCLNRRIATKSTMQSEIRAWQKRRNKCSKPTNWQFTSQDARIKLKKLYPVLDH